MPLTQPSYKCTQQQTPAATTKHALLTHPRRSNTSRSGSVYGIHDDSGAALLHGETRAHFERMLERLERSHDEQQLAAQNKLQDVLRSHISLVEHERILFTEGEHLERVRAQQDAVHARELAELDAKWQLRAAALLARCEDEKRVVLDRIPPLELERNDALRLLKQQEIDHLTWRKAIDDEIRARERAEARLHEACKHIVTLKTCVKRLEQRPNTSDDERARATELYNKWQQSRLQLAETRGELGSCVAMLEHELSHAHEALADKRTRLAALQDEMRTLRTHNMELQASVAELRAKEQSSSESRAAERAQFEKELTALQQSVAARCAKLKDARERVAASEQRAIEASMRNQELATKLTMTLQRQSERESKWRRQKEALQTCVKQLTSVARQLQMQQQERAHETQLSQLLFGDDNDGR